LIERTLAEQVIGRGVPVIDVHLEQTQAGKRRILSWSGYPVTDNGHVRGAVGSLTDITDRIQAVTANRQGNARLGLTGCAVVTGPPLVMHLSASTQKSRAPVRTQKYLNAGLGTRDSQAARLRHR
jgi:hypothetical protein